ncbi:hypothetical protein GLW08_20540 [Pontibacillus yanchengensis]|uniref:Uncharacterized protein n=2 Tax=Pontibacillus yanchengensis TaxID=462910 RepID=A0ACC7VMI1_9BACI|nr:hypothetical protein [Pontibacillus yanchengensis]MYL35494.1 hypothetical protein [Pontibacillus yanchengensis]MYL55694.1 hypothetical protein [Pontibacillus yanchengensis]
MMGTEQINQKLRSWYVLILTFGILFFPLNNTVHAEGKWYEAPMEWVMKKLFEWILEPFIGLHEPAWHVFYSSEGKVLGMYTEEQFQNAIVQGYNMVFFVVGVILMGAIVKSFVQAAYSNFSPSMKNDLADLGLKSVFGIILLFNFFGVVEVFIQLNHYTVQMFESQLQDPTSMRDMGAKALASNDGEEEGEALKFTDLADDAGFIEQGIISFFSVGVAIWFKAFYIQRMLMVSGLIILAPLWISMMFFPKLVGLTMFGMRELYSQILSQSIHAALFWIYFWMFGEDINWLTFLIAMSMFIPISESLRFAFGATSENASKLTMAGTAAGMGTLMHGARAIGDAKNGVKNAYKERSGQNDQQQSSKQYGGSAQSASGGGGTAGASRTPNKYARNMKTAGHLAGGVGSAMGRMGGNFAGMGLSPVAQHFMAEGGSQAGEGAGFGAGAVGYGGSSALMNKSSNAVNATAEAFKGNGFEGVPSMPNSGLNIKGKAKQLGANTKTLAQNLGKGTKEFAVSSKYRNDASVRKDTNEKVLGTLGTASFGPDVGYQMGADKASLFSQGFKEPSLSDLSDNKIYATVTTSNGSYLAEKDSEGNLTRKSNYGEGNADLEKGQKVVQEFRTRTQEDGIRTVSPSSRKYVTDSSGTKNEYQGKSADANDFIKHRPVDRINNRRRT